MWIFPIKRVASATLLATASACATYTDPDAAGSAPLSAKTDNVIDRMDTAGRFIELRDHIERRLARGAPADATPLSYLCHSYSKLKQYAQLSDCLDRLDRRIAQGDAWIRPVNNLRYDGPGAAQPLALALRAEAMLEFGDYRAALAHAERAVATIPVPRSAMASPVFAPMRHSFNNLPLAVIAAVQAGEQDKAKRYLAQIENYSISFVQGGGGFWQAQRSNALGRAYMALGYYDKAIDELGSARRFTAVGAFADLVGPGYGGKGNSFITMFELPRQLMLGKAYAESGNIADAKSAFDGVLASPRTKEVGDLHWLALYERGRIAEREKDLPAAAKFFQAAVQVIEAQRSTINTEASKIGFAGDRQAVYARLIEVLIAQDRGAEAFDYVERSKSRALVDMLASKKDFAAQAMDPDKARIILAQLEQADAAARVQDDAGDATNPRSRNLQLVRQELTMAAPELSSLVSVTSTPLEEIGRLLGANEALVEYYYDGPSLYTFVLSGGRLQVSKLDARGLQDQVRALRQGLEDVSDRWQTPARALYDRLWRPLEGMLAGKNVVVVAHGALHYLPFAALQKSDGSFLIDRHGLRLLPSASVLKFLRPAFLPKQAQLLILGNPDLGDPTLDLKFAETEARALAQMVSGARVLVRKDASETNFKRTSGVFSRIHFAMHGKFQADNPLASGLYLAKDAENDGVLTVSELYSMRLDADLVTLSACETGLGKVASGDDVVGLTRGFLYAGSRSIVASLWSVDDKATSELMQGFYRNLLSMNKQDALRQAQIATRKSFPHPFFWAAFQLTGRSD
jgi:CHAT domain-containing protein